MTPAAAKVPSPVADCQAHQGSLTHNYTAKQLQAAFNSLPPSTREYTTCGNAISDRLSALLGNGGSNVNGKLPGASSGGSGSGTVILIVVIVVIALLGGGGALWAYRRNRAEGAPGA